MAEHFKFKVMNKHNKLGKVIDQIGGLRIREVETKDGKEYGLYAGKRLFKQKLNPDTLRTMANKIKNEIERVQDTKHKGKPSFYSQELFKEYFAFMDN